MELVTCCRSQTNTLANECVALSIKEKRTLRRIYTRDRMVELYAENPALPNPELRPDVRGSSARRSSATTK